MDEQEFQQALVHVDLGRKSDFAGFRVDGHAADPVVPVIEFLDRRFGGFHRLIRCGQAAWFDWRAVLSTDWCSQQQAETQEHVWQDAPALADHHASGGRWACSHGFGRLSRSASSRHASGEMPADWMSGGPLWRSKPVEGAELPRKPSIRRNTQLRASRCRYDGSFMVNDRTSVLGDPAAAPPSHKATGGAVRCSGISRLLVTRTLTRNCPPAARVISPARSLRTGLSMAAVDLPVPACSEITGVAVVLAGGGGASC